MWIQLGKRNALKTTRESYTLNILHVDAHDSSGKIAQTKRSDVYQMAMSPTANNRLYKYPAAEMVCKMHTKMQTVHKKETWIR